MSTNKKPGRNPSNGRFEPVKKPEHRNPQVADLKSARRAATSSVKRLSETIEYLKDK